MGSRCLALPELCLTYAQHLHFHPRQFAEHESKVELIRESEFKHTWFLRRSSTRAPYLPPSDQNVCNTLMRGTIRPLWRPPICRQSCATFLSGAGTNFKFKDFTTNGESPGIPQQEYFLEARTYSMNEQSTISSPWSLYKILRFGDVWFKAE